MTDCSGFELTIPADLADELREKVRSGYMTFAEFDHRIAEELHRTGPRPLLMFLYETYLED
jgi:hypothetical protein